MSGGLVSLNSDNEYCFLEIYAPLLWRGVRELMNLFMMTVLPQLLTSPNLVVYVAS